MNFPDTPATHTTEAIMAKVREKIPDLPTWQYNRIFSAAHEVLSDGEKPLELKPNDAMGEFLKQRRGKQT